MYQNQKITDKFLSNISLFENLLGRYSNTIAYRRDIENCKKILSDVYGYKDIWDVVPPQIDDERFNGVLDRVFQYYNTDTENNGIFGRAK